MTQSIRMTEQLRLRPSLDAGEALVDGIVLVARDPDDAASVDLHAQGAAIETNSAE